MRKDSLEQIYQLARKDKNIVFIGSDLGAGTLSKFKEEMPKQFFMEGISEAHVVTMAAGLASEGNTVFVNSIASFLLRRSFEQFYLDVCCENHGVILIGNGGGLVYGPLGHTHVMCDDFALLSNHPNLTVLAPADSHEMRELIKHAAAKKKPCYIRVGKGNEPDATSGRKIAIGREQIFRDSKKPGKKAVLAVTGKMLHTALEAQKISSCCLDIYHYSTVRPWKGDAFIKAAKESSIACVLEEHVEHGGLGSLAATALLGSGFQGEFKRFFLSEKTVFDYGRQEDMLSLAGLDAKSIAESLDESKTNSF